MRQIFDLVRIEDEQELTTTRMFQHITKPSSITFWAIIEDFNIFMQFYIIIDVFLIVFDDLNHVIVALFIVLVKLEILTYEYQMISLLITHLQVFVGESADIPVNQSSIMVFISIYFVIAINIATTVFNDKRIEKSDVTAWTMNVNYVNVANQNYNHELLH